MNNGSGYTFGNLHDWRTDPDKCTNGAPFDLGQGRTLIVRRANINDREIQAQFAAVDRDDEKATQEVFARTLVKDWRGFVDDKGEPIPFSPEACAAMLAYANEIWEPLQRFAMNRANYAYTQNQEEIAGVKASRDGAQVQAPTANN